MPNIVIVGAQWGDEGKGKIVDLLTPRVQVVARYNGGHNAGHTVIVGEKKFILHVIPSGILHEGVLCVAGNGMVINPVAFEIEKKEVDGMTVHLVDLQGTYNDRRGPFAPGVRRENYRMLGAIVEGKSGLYFLKFYGPKKTMKAHEEAFQKIIDSINAQ